MPADSSVQDEISDPHDIGPGRSPILTYLLAAKHSSWLQAVSVLFLARSSSVIGTYVLKVMATESNRNLLVWDLGLYGLSAVSQISLFFLFVYLLYKLCIVPASSKLHKALAAAIFSQGMAFFQTTQTAEIINLFTNDMSRIDGTLNVSIASLMGQYTNLVLACGVLVVSSPLSIIFVIPVMAAGYKLQLIYLDKLRDLRRLDVSSRAPLLEYLQEAEKGRIIFSTYRTTSSRLMQFNESLARNLQAMFPLSCLDLWLGVRLEVISVILQVVAVGFLLSSSADPGTLGFVMSYLFTVTATLSNIAKISAQCEADAVSVARVDEYSKLAEKGEIQLDGDTGLIPYTDADPDNAWPQSGRVEFKSVSARHRPGLPVCLNSVSLDIQPGEKIAVVGRTGAGKSSMVLSLLRMMDMTSGEIHIDGVNIANVSPVRLRRSIALMPQGQVVLSSSVRRNLDPLGRHADEEIMECLETCGLLGIIGRLVGSEKSGDRDTGSLLDVEIENG